MRALIVRSAQLAFALALAALLFLPLVSVFRHTGVALTLKGIVGTLLVVTAVRPAAGVVALAVLLPLALAFQHFLGTPPTATVITDALVLAFGVGAALRLTVPDPAARDRLGRPALVLGVIIAASALVSLVGEQAADPARDVVSDLWRQVNGRFLFVSRPFSVLHASMRWLALLALAVFVERALRRSPAAGPVAVRMFLVGGAAAACFAALRLATLLLEGRISSDRFAILWYVVREVRITALHQDPNAAGSYFLLFLVPAALIGLRLRVWWLLGVVCPLTGLAFLLAQSRAALLAAGIVPALMAIVALVRARRYAAVLAVVVAVSILGMAARVITGSSHAPLGRAAIIRQEMSFVALEMARDHPVFGVGAGRFATVSRSYIDEDYPVLRRWAPRGQNAHNNFLQILAEFGVPAFVAFLWLMAPPVRRWQWPAAGVAEGELYASALGAGLVAFLVSAVFGHPLLIVQVAAAFFFALGVAAGLTSPAGAGRTGRMVTTVAVIAVLLTLPWRFHEQRGGDDPESDAGGARMSTSVVPPA